MKTSPCWVLGFLFILPILARGQGTLTPPGGPAPTMKSLQELWDKVDALEREVATVRESHAILQETAASQSYFLASVFQDQLPWTITVVDAAGVTGGSTSLAFGPDRQPVISYYDITNSDLRFARFDGTIWTAATVDDASATGEFASLAFGPNGQPAIAYYGRSNGSLRYARVLSGFWVPTTVDDAAAGQYSSLAFGPDGRPATAYHAGTESELRFSRFNGSSWTATTVDATGSTAAETSLAFGPEGQPVISYYDATGGDLRLARRYVPSP